MSDYRWYLYWLLDLLDFYSSQLQITITVHGFTVYISLWYRISFLSMLCPHQSSGKCFQRRRFPFQGLSVLLYIASYNSQGYGRGILTRSYWLSPITLPTFNFWSRTAQKHFFTVALLGPRRNVVPVLRCLQRYYRAMAGRLVACLAVVAYHRVHMSQFIGWHHMFILVRNIQLCLDHTAPAVKMPFSGRQMSADGGFQVI
jgi:hypothetical protein